MNFDIEEEEEQEEDVKDEYEDKQRLHIILIAFFAVGILIVIITLIILSSGKSKNNQQQVTPPKTVTQTPTTPTEDTPKLSIFDESSNERPIAVMIDNTIGEAKHAGLQDSYLNYEIPIDGGVTRIMAIFKDTNATLVGPIRSSIFYFIDYALENDAIYVHYGLENYEKQNEQQVNVSRVDGVKNPEAFRRDSKATPPHNVFSKLPYIKSYLTQANITQSSDKWQNMNYSAKAVDLTENTDYNAKAATRIIIPYGQENRSYSYDTANNYYYRYSNGKNQYDRKSSQQLHYKNIIIQRVQIGTMQGQNILEAKTVGSGTGYYITNGKFLPIKWSKQSREGKTTYTFENGTEITLNDGNTFVQIVPTDANITIE